MSAFGVAVLLSVLVAFLLLIWLAAKVPTSRRRSRAWRMHVTAPYPPQIPQQRRRS